MSDKDIKRLTNLIEKFIISTTKEVISTQKTMKEGDLTWKNKILGPTLETLNSMLNIFTKIISNYTQNSADSIDSLIKIQSALQVKKESLNIDGTALIGIDKIIFPKSKEDEVYIGLLDENGLRNGEGSLTNGEILYKGNWKNDMKSGFGMQLYEDGWVFEGNWEDDIPQNGRWMVGNNKYFYGLIHKDPSSWKSYRVGFSQQDKKKFKGDKNVKNILYWRNQATKLMNVKVNQEFNLKALEGVSKKEEHRTTTITWIHKVK